MVPLGGDVEGMFNKVLIANRGEIAVRIIRSCKELGIRTVAIFSEPDRDALHTKLADEAHFIGRGPVKESYLNAERVLDAVEKSKAEAIHPGYGFFAEDPDFAETCEKIGVTFIGPPSHIIQKMAVKTSARKAMREAGIPVIMGCDEPVEDDYEALEVAEKIGYPVAVKGVYTGGGRSIHVGYDRTGLAAAFKAARAEAERYSGKPDVYIEKYFNGTRHVEVQILADIRGHVIHLGERDCSIQRRHQKLIEEAPSPATYAGLREVIGNTAVRGAKAVGYASLGTMEFLLQDGNFYFMEVNPRIQVEHPITEMVTGVDLVKEQIRLAAGEELGFGQEDIEVRGWAIECRINAEDPCNNFSPSPGLITRYVTPDEPHVRVDSGIYEGYYVPPFYDSLVSKLIVWGSNRLEAVRRMRWALDNYVIEGIKTTIPFHRSFWDGGHGSDPLFSRRGY